MQFGPLSTATLFSSCTTVRVKKLAPKLFCNIFPHGVPVMLKIFLIVVQPYSNMYTNFCPFIYINICINNIDFTSKTPEISAIQFITKFMIFFVKNKSHHMTFN